MTATPVIGNSFFGLDVSGLSGGFASIRRRISRSTLLLELTPHLLQIAEARQRSRGLEIRHFSRVPLPEGALERSVPTAPDVMAQLLLDLCQEKDIVSHRASVVLPPELAFQRLVKLQEGLSVKEARDYLLDPRNGINLPFPLAQTDFDLVPLEAFNPAQTEPGQTTYQLTAIPCSLVDPVLSMLDLAGFDLQALEFGSFSSLRLIQDGLPQLGAVGVSLLLDFLPDATLVNLVCAAGLIESERLPSIREFPRYELSELDLEQVLNRSQSLEGVTVKNERYLPLSEMDLRAFVHDLEVALTNWLERFPDSILTQVYLIGDGSAHPGLAELLQNNLNCPVQQVRPLLAQGLRDWTLDEPLLQSSLTRLVGLGLGLLGVDQVEDQAEPLPAQDSGFLVDLTLETGLVDAEWESRGKDSQPILGNAFDDVSQVVVDTSLVMEPVDEEVSESIVQDDESEWPSLKLDVNEVTIEAEKKEADVVESESASVDLSGSGLDESEWPSLKLPEVSQLTSTPQSGASGSLEPGVIPGLSSEKNRNDQADVPEGRDEIDSVNGSSSRDSPLGELRFQNN